ncbi:hypothetical protein AC249_AIPGENE12641 [Exaiptasia diaphana]|nr:hypothetical protein AC249_AIPGENE12641 [Exaiptasia diaphana]
MNNTSLIPDNATNNSSRYQYCKYSEPDTQLEYNAKRIAVILLMTLGLAGNIFVIVLAVKYTVRKNLHHLIINMAVSDSLFILMVLTEDIGWLSNSNLSLTYPDGILGDILCKTKLFLHHVSFRVSLDCLLYCNTSSKRFPNKDKAAAATTTTTDEMATTSTTTTTPITTEASAVTTTITSTTTTTKNKHANKTAMH